MKKPMFPHALLLLALLPAACAPESDGAGSLQNRTQAGTWTDEVISYRLFADDSLSAAPPSDSCAAPLVLLEGTSSLCTPDGKFSAECDLCCDPNTDSARCQGYKNAEDYSSSQLDQASSYLTTTNALSATSAILISFADYYVRTTPSKSATTTDRERACSAYNKASLHYSRSADVVGPLKPFGIKVSSGNTSSELAIRNALLGPRHSLLLLQRACQDTSSK